jgi:hypothetical protein
MHQPYDHCISRGKGDPLGWRVTVAIWPAVIVALLSATLGPASGETRVQGQPDDMFLQAENASIGEVLAALSAEFKLTYKLASNPGRTVTGIYSGTLQQVLVRVLDSHDYFIKNLDDSVEIVVLGASSVMARSPPGPVFVPSAASNANVVRTLPGPTIAANQNKNAPPMSPLKPNMPR